MESLSIVMIILALVIAVVGVGKRVEEAGASIVQACSVAASAGDEP